MQPALPVEILRVIVDGVSSVHDLLRLRAANWILCAIATPAAFRFVGATNTARSARNLRHLLECKDVAQHVREVIYEDSLAQASSDVHPLATHDFAVQRLLADAFVLVGTLPNIDTLSLTFYPACNTENPAKHALTPCLAVQTAVLAAVASTSRALAGRLKHLNLNGLLAQYHSIYESEPFQHLLWSAPNVRITTSAELPHFGQWFDFWFHNIQSDILEGLARSEALTSLELRFGSKSYGHEPVDLDCLTFPALKCISIPGVEVDVEQFIARHAHLEHWDDTVQAWNRGSGWYSYQPQKTRRKAAETA